MHIFGQTCLAPPKLFDLLRLLSLELMQNVIANYACRLELVYIYQLLNFGILLLCLSHTDRQTDRQTDGQQGCRA